MRRAIAGLLILPLFLSAAVAQVPKLLNYQGRLTDSSGNPVTTPAGSPDAMAFAILDGAGNTLWNETQSVSVTNGLFSVQLGASNPLPASVFSGTTTYLQVKVNGETMSPNRQLVMSPYAANAQLVQGKDFGLLYTDTTNARVGIGTSAPTLTLTLKQTGAGLMFANDGLSANDNPTIQWNSVGSATGLLFKSDGVTRGQMQDNGMFVAGSLGTYGGIYLQNLGLQRGGNGPQISLGQEGGPPAFGLDTVSSQTLTPLLQLSNGGVPKLTVNASGDLGLGTTSPAAKLDIRGGNLNVQYGVTASSVTASSICLGGVCQSSWPSGGGSGGGFSGAAGSVGGSSVGGAAVTNAGYQNYPGGPFTLSLPSAGIYFISEQDYYQWTGGCADVLTHWSGANIVSISQDGKWQACGASGSTSWNTYAFVVSVNAATTLTAQYQWTNPGTSGIVQFGGANFTQLDGSSGLWSSASSPLGAIYFNGGDVGIGTASPSAPLQVYSTGAGSFGSMFKLSTGTAAGSDVLDIRGSGTIYQNGVVRIDASGTINVGGNTGVGFEQPANNGNLNITTAGNNGGITAFASGLALTPAAGAPLLDLIDPDAGGKRIQIISNTSGLRINDVTGGSSFVFGRNSGATTDFIVDGSGRVGIGTSAPSSTLDVNGGITSRSNAGYGDVQMNRSGAVLAGNWPSAEMWGLGWGDSSRNVYLKGTDGGAANLDINGSLQVGSYGGINSVPTSYGTIGLTNAENGYYGILMGQGTGNANVMYDGGGNGGIYYQNWGWAQYYNTGSRHLSINSSSDAGYGLNVYSPNPYGLYVHVPASVSPIGGIELDVDSFVTSNNAANSYFMQMRDLGSGRYQFYMRGDGVLFTSGGFVNSSDARLKKDIKPISGALEKLQNIRAVSYRWKDGSSQNEQIGVLAQEVQKEYPQLVEKADGYLSVDYGKLSAVLLEAVKEQQDEIESLRKELDRSKR